MLANFPMVWEWCLEILFLNLNLTVFLTLTASKLNSNYCIYISFFFFLFLLFSPIHIFIYVCIHCHLKKKNFSLFVDCKRLVANVIFFVGANFTAFKVVYMYGASLGDWWSRATVATSARLHINIAARSLRKLSISCTKQNHTSFPENFKWNI